MGLVFADASRIVLIIIKITVGHESAAGMRNIESYGGNFKQKPKNRDCAIAQLAAYSNENRQQIKGDVHTDICQYVMCLCCPKKNGWNQLYCMILDLCNARNNEIIPLTKRFSRN